MSGNFDPRRPFIVYVGPFNFPEGGAAARRILGNSLSLAEAGYQVLILSGQKADDDSVWPMGNNIFLASTNERDAEGLPNVLRFMKYALMGAKSRRWLERLGARPAAVILYSGYTPYLLQLGSWRRRNRTPLIFDAVEWYTAASPLSFTMSPYLWQIEFAMRVLTRRVDGVIAISRYLEDWYRGAGLPVVRIPPTLNIAGVAPGPGSDGDRLSLIYAGAPGSGKDQLDEIVRAVAMVDPEGHRLVLNIYGPTAGEVMRLPSMRRKASAAIEAHGPVSHARALDAIGRADFSVLMRRPGRVATAGFSTKVVESMAAGTPVIANLTGDLGEHLIDGVNSLVCDGYHAEPLVATLNRALALGHEERQDMRAAARRAAAAGFDHRVHIAALSRLVESARRAIDGNQGEAAT